MRILAIDASIRSTGYAVLEYANDNETECIEVLKVDRIVTKKTNDENMAITIAKIASELVQIALEYEVKEISLEDGFLGKNGKTAMLLCGLRQSIITAFYLNDIHTTTYLPSVIRSTVMGSGNVGKREIAEHIQTIFTANNQVKNLGDFHEGSGKKKNDDMYDAISIGLAHIIPHTLPHMVQYH